jgi:hypothetical protein
MARNYFPSHGGIGIGWHCRANKDFTLDRVKKRMHSASFAEDSCERKMIYRWRAGLPDFYRDKVPKLENIAAVKVLRVRIYDMDFSSGPLNNSLRSVSLPRRGGGLG